MARHIRWYVNVNKWRPTRDQWIKLAASISDNELERINKFVFKEDSKSSLIGHALIRKFLSQALNLPSNEPQLTRNKHGRPEVCKEYIQKLYTQWPQALDFNVSHSGDYCILVGTYSPGLTDDTVDCSVGADVTKIVRKDSKEELDRFLSLMSRREFSRSEWSTVEQASNDRDKRVNFTRLWCLKESFIKSIGLGLAFKLQRIEFVTCGSEIPEGSFLNDTKVLVDGHQADDWCFLETALDAEHLVAIGYNFRQPLRKFVENELHSTPFEEIGVERLVTQLAPMLSYDENNWFKFLERKTKLPS